MAQRETTIERRRSLFAEAARIIEAEHARDLELEAVARRIATSRRQLQRSFAERAGTSFREHLATVRMRRAADLLRGGSMPVRDVARSVGYRQPAQFAKAFRRHHGLTPSAFRRAARDAARAGRALAAGPQAAPGAPPQAPRPEPVPA